MQLYKRLSRVGFLQNSYAFKFLFIAFLGIHIPLIGILFFVLYAPQSASSMTILLFALVMTLVATGITLVVLKRLIRPIELASSALNNYRKNRTMPLLPIEYKDEAGLLMRYILETIQDNEKYINEKQDLMYLLSHDLRTFTGNSQSLSELILAEKPTETVAQYAELIYQSTTQQLHFIESFLKLLKVQDEIAKRLPELQNISFVDINSSVEQQVKQQLTLKNIKLNSTIDVKDKALLINSELLVRVLVNLIDNAIKFSYPDSEIMIKYYIKDERMMITITDNGLGFNMNQSDAIFQKFTDQKKLGTANESSTGIGLYLCKTIVEKYKGRLIASSEGVNKGATFTLSF
ncbi:HAMP domain-containing sensor histidine kinase [Flavobacterium sp.]|uniref:sensor histidine kinase n=1 Tax=Flavobacterium sp. TaxID=239 RepID=UPI00286ACFCD|nr:HAMP domain-containing sensor histidine kinase [Flavobacterium sp.]